MRTLRVAVYTDYAYHRLGERIYAERAFALFLAELASRFERFTVIGRLAPGEERGRYELGEHVDFVPLPYYAKLSQPLPVLKAMLGSIARFWRALGQCDCVWLLGPHPVAFLFTALACLRGKRVVLGLRQDLPEYTRNRHPGSRTLLLAAWVLERSFRALGRLFPVVAVGPGLASNYRRSRRVLELTVSLVDEADVVEPGSRRADYSGELTVLSVGRLDTEKNPLMLADVLSRLAEDERRWRLVVCGEGSMAQQLAARLRELGVDGGAELRGYVPQDAGLGELYRASHMLLHVSWTEGLPQVLYEAFAAALPVVATDVGGVRDAVGDAVTLVPPGDPGAAAAALRELARDADLRRMRVEAGNALVRASTIQRESERLAEFLSGR